MTVHISPLPVEASPIPDAGLGALSTEKGNLPLEVVDVHAGITGLAAGVRITQGFRNPYDVPLEATYIFPLPDRAAVTAMRMEAAGRVVEGTLKERGQAREDYDAAIAAGRRAAIAEEERPDVFTMRVGNILPGERVTVRLTLAQPLPYEYEAPGATTDADGDAIAADADAGPQGTGTVAAGAATFRFPLVVAPRYIPGSPLPGGAVGDGTASDTDAVPDASRISPPVLLPGFPDPVRLSLTVDIDPAGLPLTDLRSSLHVIAVDAPGPAAERMTVRLEPGERLNRDFVLRLGFAAHEAASLTLVPDAATASGDDVQGAGAVAGDGTFTLTVLPSGEACSRPRDVVLVLDRSGSMGGWKMTAARRAAARIVDTLTAQDRFAVLSFDDRIEWPAGLPEDLVTATDRNRFRAVEHLAGLAARWGTEMLGPLERATGLLGDAERDRVLVLITDGQVGNEDEILSRIEPALRGVRVHTVGIDRAINAGFLGRLAMLGQGRFELVESQDRLDEAMEQIHRRIAAPLLTGLSLDASGIEIVPDTVTPSRLGSLFPGVPLVIAGRYRGPATTGAIVTVRGVLADGTVRGHEARGTVTTDPATVSIWARGHLRDLEDRYVVGPSDSLERRIVETSLRSGVLCRFTAFIAVDSRVVTEGGRPHRVTQPVEAPSGWTDQAEAADLDHGGAATGPVRPMMAAMPMAMPPMPGAAPAPAPASGPPPARPAAPSRVTRGTGRQRFAGPVPAAPPASGSPLPPLVGQSSPAGDALGAVRTLLLTELERLTDGTSVPRGQRWSHLSDLRTRVNALLARLAEAGVGREVTAPLADLAEELRAADDPARRSEIDALWDRTIAVLTEFTGPSGAADTADTTAETTGPAGGGTEGGRQPKRAFWKR